MRKRPDLIVPIRDRRQRKRVLTLRNLRNLLIGALVFVLALIIQADLRHTKPGQYGRLFGKQVTGQPVVVARTTEVVREAPAVHENPPVDALLLSSAAREQYLGQTNLSSRPNVEPAIARIAPPPEPAPQSSAVVEGPNGVTIVRGAAKRESTLSGGIFRQ